MRNRKTAIFLALLMSSGSALAAQKACDPNTHPIKKYSELEQQKPFEERCRLNEKSDVGKIADFEAEYNVCVEAYRAIQVNAQGYLRKFSDFCTEVKALEAKILTCQTNGQADCAATADVQKKLEDKAKALDRELDHALEHIQMWEKKVKEAAAQYAKEAQIMEFAIATAKGQESDRARFNVQPQNPTDPAAAKGVNGVVLSEGKFGDEILASSRGMGNIAEYNANIEKMKAEQERAAEEVEKFRSTISQSRMGGAFSLGNFTGGPGAAAPGTGAPDFGSAGVSGADATRAAAAVAPAGVAAASALNRGGTSGASMMSSLTFGATGGRMVSGPRITSAASRKISSQVGLPSAEDTPDFASPVRSDAFPSANLVALSDTSPGRKAGAGTKSTSAASSSNSSGSFSVTQAPKKSLGGEEGSAAEEVIPPGADKTPAGYFKADLNTGQGLNIAGSEVDLAIDDLADEFDLDGLKLDPSKLTAKEMAAFASLGESGLYAEGGEFVSGQGADPSIGGEDSTPIFARVKKAHVRYVRQGRLDLGLKNKL